MKRKILRDAFIINMLKLNLFLLLFLNLIHCSIGSINIPKMENGKSFIDYCKKINSYTMIIEESSNPTKTDNNVKLTTYRVGLRSNFDIDMYPNLENTFQSAISENLKVLGNKRARYISPDSLGLMNNSVENEQIRNQWISKAGIDTLIILSPEFVLDYPTRISNDTFAKFFTLFVLDWWYIDLMGAWYIENNYNLQVVDLKNNQFVGNIHSAKINYNTGKYFLSQIDSTVFEKSVKESMGIIFKTATGEIK